MKLAILFSTVIMFMISNGNYAADTTRVTITVNPEILNTFKGIGYNVTADLSMLGYKNIKNDPGKRKLFFEEFIKEANFQNLVLWGSKWWYNYKTDVFNEDYLTYFKEAELYGGIRHIIHNPTDKLYSEKLRTPFYEQLEYQTMLAKKLHERGVTLYGMTYKNKPNTNESGTFRQHQDSVSMGIRIQRQMLDSLGLNNVKMCGPTTIEWHPRNPNPNPGGDIYDYQDGDTENYLNAIIDSVGALSALYAFDKESYGDGMTTWYMEKAKQHDKDLWVMLGITENVGASDFDPNIPPVVAATLTSDINHGVSIWNTWLSYRLLVESTLKPKPLYYYLKNVSTKFQYGSSIKKCTSNPALPTVDMHWNYYNHENPFDYLQPKISGAACFNPDGSWSISLVNTSGIQAQHQIAKTLPFNVLESNIIEVELDVPELSDTLFAWFSIYKSYADKVQKHGVAEMRNGKVKILIKPGEHFVLHSDSMSNNLSNNIKDHYAATSEIDLKVYPNPFSDQVTFEYNLELESEVEFCIYDLSGRLIAFPEKGQREAGNHTIIWRGFDENGSRCAAGVYLCKFHAKSRNGSVVKYSKVILLD